MHQNEIKTPTRKQLPGKAEERIPLTVDLPRKKSKKRLRALYFLTAACTVLLAVALLIAECEGKLYSLFNRIRIDSVISSIASQYFMDLSGSEPSKTTEETPPAHTDAPLDIPTGSGGIVAPPVVEDDLYSFDLSKVPPGEIPIIPKDLSLLEYGNSYLQNETGYTPNTDVLFSQKLTFENAFEILSAPSAASEPLVLILHTHGTEAYSKNGAISYRDTEEEIARSESITQNVVAVGRELCDTLNRAGVPAIQCAVLHDQLQYKDSYARAEETIRAYLAQYPSIRLVIDLHRDAIIEADGALVRPITTVNGEKTAQVMCVVGSSWGGQDCPNWEKNLALALQLRERLNGTYGNLCRPVSLRASTYNQEIAAASLLLEIGAAGNSLEEALASAKLVGEAIAVFFKK